MRVAAFIGPSGSGKSTLICALIRRFVAGGESVAAIKHSHHPLNEERRGDTAAFAAAGAQPVIFAGDGEAIVFDSTVTRRVTFRSPRDLLAHVASSDVVLIEGFKTFGDWPRVELDSTRPIEVDDAVEILGRIWRVSS